MNRKSNAIRLDERRIGPIERHDRSFLHAGLLPPKNHLEITIGIWRNEMIATALLLQIIASPPPPTPRHPDITVTAPDAQGVTRLVLSLVDAARGQLQLARFEDRICPGVVGMKPTTAATLVRLIRENVRASGATLSAEGCAPNALVVFTPHPGPTADAIYGSLRKMRPMSRQERLDLLGKDDGIRSFRIAEPRTVDGRPLPVDKNGAPRIKRRFASRLTPEMRMDNVVALAFIDTTKASGKTVRQLADVTTMHLLLDINADATRMPSDTILTLFSRPDAPATLTALDRGLLRGLYTPKSNAAFGDIQRARIARAVREEQQEVLSGD